MVEGFARRGWVRFAWHPDTARWAAAARAEARRALTDPAFARWHVCEGTWFVGVDALGNGPDGSVAGQPLAGPAADFVAARFGAMPPLHRGQVSAVFPGYPRPRAGESAAAFRYRRDRDAAHLDGLKADGPGRRRRIAECHGFILGLPLNPTDPGAAPLVAWEGSHEIMRAALLAALAPHPPEAWGRIDLTEAYAAARRRVFAQCPRRVLHGRPGEAWLLHRLTLHGIAPWAEGARAPAGEGRMIAYFRPRLAGAAADWLRVP